MTELYRAGLDREEDLLYLRLLESLRRRERIASIPPSSCETVGKALRAVLADHPELPWANGKWRGTRPVTDRAEFSFGLDEAESRRFRHRLEELEIRCGALREQPAEERAARLYDRILDFVRYDAAAPQSQNAYGALVDGRALCRGIAKAFQLLAECCALPCSCLEGTLDGSARHVWNVVELEGSWYHVDVCMAYPQFFDSYGRKSLRRGRAAFLVSDATLSASHGWNRAQAPVRCPDDRK